jgi:hypothetical protein
MTRLFGFLTGKLPEHMVINDLLQRMEEELLDCGRRGEGERIAQVAARLARARDLDRALESLYCVRGWEGVAVRLMWYGEQMRQAAVGHASDADLAGYRLSQLLAAMPAPSNSALDQGRASGGRVDLGEALFRFGSALEQLRRASFADGGFIGLPETLLDRVIAEAAVLRMVASAERSRDVARFAHAFRFFATYVRKHRILQDVRVLQVLGSANLTLQTVLETAEAEDFDSLDQTIALLENPRTLLQLQ